MSLTKKSSYFYNLPEELIAQYPLKNRDQSRLLVVEKETGDLHHKIFENLLDFLRKDDLIVINNTKVIPARLLGHKTTGASVEVFLLNQKENSVWECLVKPGRKLKTGSKIIFSDDLQAEIVEQLSNGNRIVHFTTESDFDETINSVGHMPLPPYITRSSTQEDKETYQTVYAKEKGSVAAPTAGLHFTPELLEKLKRKGIEFCEVMLHVGLGTFRPVKTDSIKDHKMHSEYCSISKEAADKINEAKNSGRRIIAVGTTSVRTLESFWEDGELKSGSKWTDIFIYPGKKLHVIDGLVTNFHMPESTLLMLVSAFAGYENIMRAYKAAVEEKYRFFSYGDAMLLI